MQRVVTDPRAIKVLLAEPASTYLEAYLGQTRSVAQAAEHVDQTIQRTHYWTRRFAGVGLVEQVDEVPRAGRAIRRYRSVADEFVIPAESLPYGLFASQMQQINRALTRAFEESYPQVAHGGDLRIHRSGLGARGISYDRNPPPGSHVLPDALQSSFTLRLTPAEGRQLRDELAQLRDRWLRTGTGRAEGRGHYLAVVAIAPLPAD